MSWVQPHVFTLVLSSDNQYTIVSRIEEKNLILKLGLRIGRFWAKNHQTDKNCNYLI
jgi:hypothetical protein